MADFLTSNIADLKVKLGKDANNRLFGANTQWPQHTTAFTGDIAIKYFYKAKCKLLKSVYFFKKLKK